jgi:hypothetical protein
VESLRDWPPPGKDATEKRVLQGNGVFTEVENPGFWGPNAVQLNPQQGDKQ